jgi:hypothetical protein
VISLITKSCKGGTQAGVQLSLSKVSTVRLTVRQGSQRRVDEQRHRRTRQAEAAVAHPGKGGTFTRHASATDLAGNFATTTGTITVPRARRRTENPALPRSRPLVACDLRVRALGL